MVSGSRRVALGPGEGELSEASELFGVEGQALRLDCETGSAKPGFDKLNRQFCRTCHTVGMETCPPNVEADPLLDAMAMRIQLHPRKE